MSLEYKNIPYCYLSKMPGLDTYNLFVVIPNDGNYEVDFSKPPYGDSATGDFTTKIDIYLTKVQEGAQQWPVHRYPISKNNPSHFSNDTHIEISVYEKAKPNNIFIGSVKRLYEYADEVALSGTDIAENCPYIVIVSPIDMSGIRRPRVIIPVKDNHTLTEVITGVSDGQLGNVHTATITSSDGLINWKECTAMNAEEFTPHNSNEGTFESSVAANGNTRKSKTKDKHYIEQPGWVFEELVNMLLGANNSKKILPIGSIKTFLTKIFPWYKLD